jgi:hypothetical protein
MTFRWRAVAGGLGSDLSPVTALQSEGLKRSARELVHVVVLLTCSSEQDTVMSSVSNGAIQQDSYSSK